MPSVGPAAAGIFQSFSCVDDTLAYTLPRHLVSVENAFCKGFGRARVGALLVAPHQGATTVRENSKHGGSTGAYYE